jgi:hypothetical protein
LVGIFAIRVLPSSTYSTGDFWWEVDCKILCID